MTADSCWFVILLVIVLPRRSVLWGIL